MSRVLPLAAALVLLAASTASAAHYRLFVLTGQSNSLGTTNGTEADLSPGSDAADARVKFFWHNVADASTSIGDSGGLFNTLQPQQGGHYPGSAIHWGPEIDFARTLVRAGVANVAIVKASRGGGGNTNWSKAANGHMYAHVVATVTAAANTLTVAGDTFEVVGLLYVQGESDTTAEADIAGTRFKELVDNLRADLPNAASMKAVIGGIATAGAKSDTVRARHAAIADATPYIDYFSNLDLQSQVTDGLHFNKAAKLRIGRLFAQAFFANNTITRNYGKLTFIGDSITQGGNGDHPSYRYQVFKRFAETGVPINSNGGYKFTGSVNGPQTTPVLTAPDVNGQVFENVHEGHYGWRASWINARVRLPANRRGNNRGEGTLLNWTSQANPQQYDISGPDATVSYPDSAASGTGNTGTTYLPDTVSIMIGINDLGDDNNSANQVVADIGTLIDQLRAANPDVRVFVNHLLHTDQTTAMRDAVDAVNGQLATLAATKNSASGTSPVWVIDASTGFDPVTMTYDGVHPNALGEEHVGDHIAAALGVIELPLPSNPPPPHVERESSAFDTRYEGNDIWNGSVLLNGWAQTGTLTRSLPEPTDLRVIHPSTDGRWIEGTGAGWSAINSGTWTCETRLKCDANVNGFVLWFGTGSRRIIVEVHGNRTQDIGGESFNVPQNNQDGAYHTFRVVHDASNSRYHVFRDALRLTPPAGAAYDQTGTDNRLILGDYTSGIFGNHFDVTIDHIRFTDGAFLPAGLDTDANGMPDSWEYQYFGVLSGTNPFGNPDEDGYTNLQEFENGTHPLVADHETVTMPVFLIAGGGNARGTPGTSALNSLPPGQHAAEQPGGVRFHDGSGWTVLGAAGDGSYGPEIAFARLLWDCGLRDFAIIKSTKAGGGNSLWHKGSGADSAYQALLAAATNANANLPLGIDALDFRALLFIQGEENDSIEAAAADTRFAALLDNLKADLSNASTLQGILGEIGGTGTNRDTTRARHAALAAGRADIGLARNTGTTVHNEDGLGVHYTGDSLFLLGSRLAAEAMNLTGGRPLPAWDSLHAWYVADHAAVHGTAGEVTRWGAVNQGDGVRDLGRRVSGRIFRRAVTTGSGQPREVMRFDGTNDLWSNATTEFGTINGARTVAMLCRLTGSGSGFLFDGSTNTGRTRAQTRSGSWQAGVTPSGTGFAWDLSEPVTTTANTGWQRHVFTYAPNAGNTATTVQHWIDGTLAATATENEVAALGGLIVGANGGSPFSRLAVEIAEIAVYRKTLDAAEIGALDAAWSASWGTPSGPPLAVRVRQNTAEIPRFGWHPVIEIEVDAPSEGWYSLRSLDLELRQSAPGAAARWRLLAGPVFSPSTAPLAEISGSPATWSPTLNLALLEGSNKLFLAVEPERHAPLRASLDAGLGEVTISSATGPVVPATPDPAGALTLAQVPMFTDVVRSGDLGIHTFRIPGIVCDSNGVLHAVYDHRYNGSGDLPGNIDVGYSRSTDGGATWSVSKVIMDFDASVPNSSGNGVGDPCILHDPATDTLWAAALWSFGNRAYNGSGPGLLPSETGQYVLVKSDNGGETWSAPINITAQVKDPAWRLLFCGPGHGLTLRDGTLVFPSQMRRDDGLVRMCFVFSRDHGATWRFGSVIPDTLPQTNENEFLELDDGRLLFSGRTPSGSNGQRAWSHYTPAAMAEGVDPLKNGTWSTIYRLPSVPDPVCQATVIHWKSGLAGHPREQILFANPATGGRNGMTIRLSQDGGLTWPVSRLLYAGSSAYSSLTVLPDGSVGLLFERDNYTKITFARVEADWIMNPDADSDSDHIPDAWESLSGLNPSADDSLLDSDSDGATNLSEWIAGTDPLDRTSGFTTSGFSVGGVLGLSWQSVPGKTYAIEQSDDLSNWTSIAGVEAVTATSAETAVEIPGNGAARRFLRVRVVP